MWNRSLSSLLAASLCLLVLTACHNDDGPTPGGDTEVPPPTHSIGGTVAGSTGSLTLQNSNGTQLVVAASGAFTFATPMTAGALYSVTVATPPNGQSCVVTAGSGTVPVNGDVTNIQVTCTTNSYSVGGAVGGLGAGKSVTLHLGADANSFDLTIFADGQYTFPVTLPDNAEFLVEVAAQPMNQTCNVINGQGDIAGASVSNVAVSCINNSASARNWANAANIATDTDAHDQNGIRSPRVAYDSAGNAIAVWEADALDRVGSNILWSRRPAGGAWTAPAQIPYWAPPPPDPGEGDYLQDPVLAVAPNGTAVAAWRMSHFAGAHVMASTFDPATGWTTPVFVWRSHPDISDGGRDLKIAVDSAGNVLIAWVAAGSIMYNRFTPGSGWVVSADVAGFGKLVSTLKGPADEPELAMNPAGEAVAIWRQGFSIFPNPPFDFDLHASRYDMATDTWSEPQQVEDAASDEFAGKSVVIDATGTATALWSDLGGVNLHVRASRLVGDSWSPSAIVETGATGEFDFAFDPHAVVDGNGNVTAVWQQGDVDQANFFASRYAPGTGWGAQQAIGTYVGSSSVIFSTELRLAGNSAGHVVALWTLPGCVGPENVPCPTDLLANEYNPVNGEWGAEEVIDKEYEFLGEVVGDASTPWVAVDAAGNAVGVWDQDLSDATDGIRFSVFE